jgi:uncharacterized protein
MRMWIERALTAALLVVAQPLAAGPLEEGVAAHKQADYAKALKLLRPLAEQGVAEANYYLAKMYVNGQGVTQNGTEALKRFRLAAERGHSGAQVRIAFEYDAQAFIRDSAANKKEALRLYRLAAEQGNPDAQRILGHKYADGLPGAKPDYKEAVKWYRLAAAQGNAPGQSSLGEMYQQGKGVLQDFAEAARWYRLAAEQGDGDAQYRLALIYRNGQGVAQDLVRAHALFNLASISLWGDNAGWARDKRDEVAAKLTSAQIVQAQEMARKCDQSKFKDCGW